MIKSAIACNLDTHILQTALPLFEKAEVEAVEWSFDTLTRHRIIPDWFIALLNTFSEGDGLVGHGVFFSLFSGNWTADQTAWLAHLRKVSTNFKFQHITEHFGFMTGANFHDGAPISVPLNKTLLTIGQDRLQRIYESCQCPVGLENLAFNYSLDEVKRHGAFLEKLVVPINGFIILDLHNLYCQIHNFQIPFDQLIDYYPLERVREIHISGGSWEASALAPEQKVRRDTHDDAVPEIVFEYLEKSIALCKNLKYVVLEQLGNGLRSTEAQQTFQSDFRKMKSIVRQTTMNSSAPVNNFFPSHLPSLGLPLTDDNLHRQQLELSNILENEKDLKTVKAQLAQSSLANTDWQIESWSPHMLETVIAIAQKWK